MYSIHDGNKMVARVGVIEGTRWVPVGTDGMWKLVLFCFAVIIHG